MAAAEGQRLAVQQMMADARDKGAPTPESAPTTEGALPALPSAGSPRSSAGGADRQAAGQTGYSLFSKGQLEAWSSGTLSRGDNQVTSAASAPGAPAATAARAGGTANPAVNPAVNPAANPAANPGAPAATVPPSPAALPAAKPPARKPKLSLPKNPVRSRSKR